MTNRKQELFDYFGKRIIETARDLTIHEELKIVEGTALAPLSKRLSKQLHGIDPKYLEAIKELIIDTVDGALNNFLWVIEQEDFSLVTINQDDPNNNFDLKGFSDGLCGDYWNFVDDFSTYKRLDSEPT